MRRPASPGSARERDGRTRRAGAGRADAGEGGTADGATGRTRDGAEGRPDDRAEDRADDRVEERTDDRAKDGADDRATDRAEGGATDRAAGRVKGRGRAKETAKDAAGDAQPRERQPRERQPRRGDPAPARLPAQPGRADRETRRAAGPAAGERAGAGRTAATRAGAAAARTRAEGTRTGRARTDGRGRRIGAGGVGAIPGSSGGTRTPRRTERRDEDEGTAARDAGSADEPTAAAPTAAAPPAEVPTAPTGNAATGDAATGDAATTAAAAATADAAGASDGNGDGTGAGRPARPVRPRPVRLAPHIVRRRRIALLVVVLVLLGGLAGGVAFLLYGSGLADVETVSVEGALAVPQDQILATAAIPTGGPLAGVDTSGAEQRVATLPGVESVTVGRDWPHTVVVTVVERVAVALADTPKGLMLVDRTGVPYEQAPEVPPVLPHLNVSITGTVAPGDVQTTAGLGVLAALPDAVRSEVLTITVIAPAATGGLPTVELALSDDRRVVWGSAENSQRKAAVLTALLTERGSVFDVASPDLPTIRR
ncbi:cell division protein FtsQ/DivIB [Pseudonocardia sp.]|uniref:cell division protein FtsQ/DivIB n=1 Tax=Pseudonocardia sp. TaxID=60912 RepID=UPI003D0BCA77